MFENRLEDLLAQMTLREKIGQMSQAHGGCEEHKTLVRAGSLGSLLNIADPEVANEFQRIAVAESRLGIPLLLGRDVIHGFRTVFPIPLGQAASWHPALVEAAARIGAREAAACGIRWTFSPMVDIARDPRWGRIAEGSGEDPLLAGAMGAAMVRGYQGRALDDPESIAACVKHYVAYGATEGGRDYNTADISERTLREIYLPSFKACVDAGAATLMSAFNEISGIPASGNAFTLRQVLREEWGFEGFVVSDWASIEEMIAHGFCANKRDAACAGITAGVDMEMASTCYQEHLEALVDEGIIPLAMIDDAVRNILRIKFRLGLFDNAQVELSRRQVILCPEHLQTARELARMSCVLLKNDGQLLPLRKDLPSLAVIGPLADNPLDQLGCWTMDGKTEEVQTPLNAIRAAVSPHTRVVAAPGLADPCSVDRAGFAAAVCAAEECAATILFLGESALLSGEAHSRAFLELPGAQQELFAALAATGKPLVVVLLTGRPLTIAALTAEAPALLLAWHPGTMGGPAIADLLFGDHAPSGKLPVTFPRTVGQIPLYYNHKNTGRPPRELVRDQPMGTPLDPVNFCSNYLDVEHIPLFPFGFGLSYTQFAYQCPVVTVRDGQYTLAAQITNCGKREGKEVVQLYIRDITASVTRPVKELKGFQRITLAPGESKTVEFTLSSTDLSFLDRAGQRVTEPGQFLAWIAGDSASGEAAEFTIY